jgi:DNA-binding CsgD family transcriptional regulator
LRYLGTSSEASRALADLAGQTRSTVWNLQRIQTFYALRNSRGLDEAARRRGATFRLVVRPGTLRVCPIFSSYEPDARVGPVPGPLMVLDSRHVVFPGRDGESIWTSSDPHLVAHAMRAYEVFWTAARPAVPPGEEPPLTPRMVDIAWLLADGASDRRISRELGVSERTVSNEVREIGRRLGAANRAHTIARICGAPI